MFRAALLNGRDLSHSPVEVSEDDISGVTLTFTDRWTSVSGVVRLPSGATDAAAAVIAFPTEPGTWGEAGLNPRRLRITRTDLSGRYSLRGIPVGEYFVIAIPDERASDWREPRLLEQLARTAEVVSGLDGEQKVHDLQTQEVR